MNKKVKSDSKSEAASLTVELLESLLQHDDLSSRDLWQLHEDHAPQDKLQAERHILEKLIEVLLQSNPEMISRRIVLDVILYRIIGDILDNLELRKVILPKLGMSIKNLLTFRAFRDIDVPIVNIELEGEPFKLGDVEFIPIKDEDRAGSWWDHVRGAIGESTAIHCVVSFGRVEAQGDLDNSTLIAGPIVDDAILILRGIAFPFTKEEVVQIGIVGDVSLNRTQYYKLGTPEENVRLESPSTMLARLGPPLGPYYLYKDLLSHVSETDLEDLLNLIDSEGFNPTKRMASKLLSGIRWIGEASKIDTTQSRFAKLTFALENLIGGEPQDQKLASTGLTAMLAERAAFLVGEDTDHRLMIDKDVRKYYGKRSDIVHGRSVDISDDDLIAFALLVRNVAWALLRNIDRFNTVDELQRWVKEQRYS